LISNSTASSIEKVHGVLATLRVVGLDVLGYYSAVRGAHHKIGRDGHRFNVTELCNTLALPRPAHTSARDTGTHRGEGRSRRRRVMRMMFLLMFARPSASARQNESRNRGAVHNCTQSRSRRSLSTLTITCSRGNQCAVFRGTASDRRSLLATAGALLSWMCLWFLTAPTRNAIGIIALQ
jgi:hypothetical protein